MPLPALGRVPSIGAYELHIKASSSGIILLKENAFRRRYTGNKYSAVDINGNLWLKASELQKVVRGQSDKPGKKKPRVETQGGENNSLKQNVPMQISANLSTENQLLSTVTTDLSTSKKEREYTVNKREVRQRILAMLNTQAGKKELYFWTVTFFPGTTDDLAFRLFNIWLTSLRQYGMLHDYLWIAERQDGKRNEYRSATNTLHFHIAIPHKMCVKRANRMMCGTLKGMVKKGELNESIYRCNRYNGVDIAKNRKTRKTINFAVKKGARSLGWYLTKYVTKNDTKFKHLAWHNSRGYSSLFTGVTFSIPEFINNGWPALLNRAKRFDTEFFTFVPWASDPPGPLMAHLYDLNSYIQSLLN